MPRNTIQGQSYALLSQVKDQGTRDAVRILMDQVNQLRQPAGTQNLGGNTITNVATPTASSDVATKSYVDAAVAGVRATLLGAGSNPLDVSGLRGQLLEVQLAKILIVNLTEKLPVNGQPFELLWNYNTSAFYYWNDSTAKWTKLA